MNIWVLFGLFILVCAVFLCWFWRRLNKAHKQKMMTENEILAEYWRNFTKNAIVIRKVRRADNERMPFGQRK